jgi:hypothetical protein
MVVVSREPSRPPAPHACRLGVELTDDGGDASVPFPFDMDTVFMGRLCGVAACTDAGGDAEGSGLSSRDSAPAPRTGVAAGLASSRSERRQNQHTESLWRSR